MISNPELQAVSSSTASRWPRHFSHWQLMSLVPGLVHRLATAARVLELEVGAPALLTILARIYPFSQFIGLTSHERAQQGHGPVEMAARNLHFRTVEQLDLSRFRQVDLVLALGGLPDRMPMVEVAKALAPGGHLLLRERDRSGVEPGLDQGLGHGARHLSMVDDSWSPVDPVRHGRTIPSLTHAFTALHALRLPEDPGFVYFVARV